MEQSTEHVGFLQFTGAGTTPPGVNFYESYCEDGTHNKPMVITETSAMYNPSNPGGQSDFSIKSNWWQQVFNVQGDTAQVRNTQFFRGPFSLSVPLLRIGSMDLMEHRRIGSHL